MAKHPKPWLRKGRGWYVQRNGVQVFLGREKSQAFKQYHALMDRAAGRVKTGFVSVLVDSFLEWVQENRAPDTYRWYKDRLQLFCGLYPDLKVSGLKPLHVQKWIDGMKVANGTKRNFARSIMRCMKWAEEQGYIEKSPLAHFKKPRGGVRQKLVSPENYRTILESIRRRPLKDLVTFAWETGARAIECLAVEARHVELENARVVFPVDEEKMERASRVIYLTATALEIVARLSKENPSGPIFRNTEGKPWTPESVNCAFVVLQIRMGKQVLKAEGHELAEKDIAAKIKTLKASRIVNGRTTTKTPQELREEAMKKLWNAAAVKKAPKFCLTAFRHSFCHRLLKAGVDALTVSNLMGHSGVSMVVEFYSHMNHAPEYLRGSLEKAG